MTIHHVLEPKAKMGKVRAPDLPPVEVDPDPSRSGPDPSPKAVRDTQPAQGRKGLRSTQNPQTAKPELYTPRSSEALAKQGTDAPRHGATQDEEDKTRPGMRHSQAEPQVSRTVKK